MVLVVSKYKAVRTGKYASKKEARRASELRLLEKAGEIADLQEQVKFVLIPKQEGERECSYIADFRYRERALFGGGYSGYFTVEDCKGMRTPMYVIKRKLMLHVHGIRIRET